MRSKKILDELSILVKKNTDTRSQQTKTRLQEVLEIKLSNSMDFSSKSSPQKLKEL